MHDPNEAVSFLLLSGDPVSGLTIEGVYLDALYATEEGEALEHDEAWWVTPIHLVDEHEQSGYDAYDPSEGGSLLVIGTPFDGFSFYAFGAAEDLDHYVESVDSEWWNTTLPAAAGDDEGEAE